jgi:hypothetical protein
MVSSRARNPVLFHQVDDSLNPQGKIMADDKSKTGQADRLRINVHEPYELRDWSQKFDVTPDKLKEAVTAVGPMAADVEKYLKK